ncbi:hypothetical protein ACSNOI_47380, partial [Actinomadura kijaniata]
MTDSGWQQSVLRDLGVSQRGFAALNAMAAAPAQSAWGAEPAPPPPPPFAGATAGMAPAPMPFAAPVPEAPRHAEPPPPGR